MTPKSLAGKLQPLMADALFFFYLSAAERRGAEQQSPGTQSKSVT